MWEGYRARHRRLPEIMGVLAVVLSVSPTLTAQSASPREVVEAYRKMDRQGERLTSSGWYSASKFFVKPIGPPKHHVMGVMFGEEIYDVRIKGSLAEVSLRRSALGQIDSKARFTSVVAPYLLGPPLEKGMPEIHGLTAVDPTYQLVFTDTYWEFAPNREGPREVKGSPQWRLEYFEPQPWVTVDVAIRYLTKLRDESMNEVIKNNADKSIEILRRPH